MDSTVPSPYPNAAKRLKKVERGWLRLLVAGHTFGSAAAHIERVEGLKVSPRKLSALASSPRGRSYMAWLERKLECAVVAAALLDLAPALPLHESANARRHSRSRPWIGYQFARRAIRRRQVRDRQGKDQ